MTRPPIRWTAAAVAVLLSASACGGTADGPDGPGGGAAGTPAPDVVVGATSSGSDTDGASGEPGRDDRDGRDPAVTSTVDRAPTGDPGDAAALAVGLDQVGLDVFRAVAGTTDEDVVVSPLSIGLAFGMADVGASGPTVDALAELFDYPVTGEDRWASFNTLEQAITSDGATDEQPIVRLADRLFPDEGLALTGGYAETLGRWFGVAVEPLPLKAASEQSRQHINGWVADRTEQLIPELLPRGFVRATTDLVLVDALYLEADWATPFGKYPTVDAPFTLLDGSTVTVPMMTENELDGPAVVTDEYAAIELPYEGGELSMLVLVPAEGRYEQVEQRLSRKLLDEVDDAMAPGGYGVVLPRFESTSAVDLKQVMVEDLGVEDVFDVEGWTGIVPDGTMLTDAVHAADIAVDEWGTVAAAATALGFNESAADPAVVVRADRPFLYVIRHDPTGAALFVGRVVDPST